MWKFLYLYTLNFLEHSYVYYLIFKRTLKDDIIIRNLQMRKQKYCQFPKLHSNYLADMDGNIAH